MINVVPMPVASSDINEPIWSEFIDDESLQNKASEVWKQILEEMRIADTFAPVNGLQVKRLVLYTILYDQAITKTVNEGPIIDSRATNDFRINPWWRVVQECDGHICVHEDNLGLTPKRRAAVTPAKKRSTQSKADKFLGAKRAS